MRKFYSITLILYSISFTVFSQSTDNPQGTEIQPENGEFTTINGFQVFYLISSENAYMGGNAWEDASLISGTGTIKTIIKKISGTSDTVVVGIQFADPDIWAQQFSFYIKSNGTYNIGWVDETSGFDGYEETGWANSVFLNVGLSSNELTVDYDTDNKKFTFFINDNQVFEKTFSHIHQGKISHYIDLLYVTDYGTNNPYRFEYKTISPFFLP
jgi:hypothetical protein